MADVELGGLLEAHASELKNLGAQLAEGKHEDFIAGLATLVAVVATGQPAVAALAPFAQKAVAWAFARTANARLRRAIEEYEKESERESSRREIVDTIGSVVEVLLGQAIVQLVRVQHNTKDEVLDALGGLRDELADFRQAFEKELAAKAPGVHVDVQLVRGGIGVRVRAGSQARAFIRRQEVGPGGVGIDLE